MMAKEKTQIKWRIIASVNIEQKWINAWIYVSPLLSLYPGESPLNNSSEKKKRKQPPVTKSRTRKEMYSSSEEDDLESMPDVESIDDDDDDLDELSSGDETDEEVWLLYQAPRVFSFWSVMIRFLVVWHFTLPLNLGRSSTPVAKVETVEGSGWFTLWVCRGQQFHFQEKAKIWKQWWWCRRGRSNPSNLFVFIACWMLYFNQYNSNQQQKINQNCSSSGSSSV